MDFVKNNRGVIVFYLLLILATLVIVQSNGELLETKREYVYLSR